MNELQKSLENFQVGLHTFPGPGLCWEGFFYQQGAAGRKTTGSIISQRMVYDHVNSTRKSITEIPITSAMLKSC